MTLCRCDRWRRGLLHFGQSRSEADGVWFVSPTWGFSISGLIVDPICIPTKVFLCKITGSSRRRKPTTADPRLLVPKNLVGTQRLVEYNFGHRWITPRCPWYYPSAGEYSTLLEAAGFDSQGNAILADAFGIQPVPGHRVAAARYSGGRWRNRIAVDRT